jgi:hypothetical protein
MTWSRPERPASSPLTAPTERAPTLRRFNRAAEDAGPLGNKANINPLNARHMTNRATRRRVAPPPMTDNMHCECVYSDCCVVKVRSATAL